MKTTLSYVLTALLAFAAAFFYFKTKEPVKTTDPPQTDIETYAIAEFFKQEAKTLIDSVGATDLLKDNPKDNLQNSNKKNLKERIQNYMFWDERLAELVNVASKNPCFSPTSCIKISLMEGCRACTKCCSGYKPWNDGYPQDFNIVAQKEMNPHFYNQGQELKIPSSESDGLVLFQFSKNQQIDKIAITINGKESQTSLPQAKK